MSEDEKNDQNPEVYEIDPESLAGEDPLAPTGIASRGNEEVVQLKKLLADAEEKFKKEFNERLYLHAEFDNYRKRAIKERSDLVKYSGERALVQILDVLDNFERASETHITQENFETFKKGIELIGEEFRSVLKKIGVEPLPSQMFDPMIFEAISTEESDSLPEGSIARVLRKAYKLHDKVIRPGQVVIAVPSKKNTEQVN